MGSPTAKGLCDLFIGEYFGEALLFGYGSLVFDVLRVLLYEFE